MMRKICLILSFALVLTLVGCTGGVDTNEGVSDSLGNEIVGNVESSSNTESSSLEQSSDDSSANESGISAKFKEAMDNYEKFMDEYITFMKKYKENPSDLSLLSDYANYMSKYTDFVSNFDKWQNEDLNSAELSYYLDVQTRVSKKLLEVAQ